MQWCMVYYSKVKETLKTNASVKKDLYDWVLNCPQVVQYPIANDCLKVSIYGNHEKSLYIDCFLNCLSDNFKLEW